jgi:hypothetical protein
MSDKSSKKRKASRAIIALLILVFLAGGFVYAGTTIWPSFGAQTIDKLRAIFGDKVIAQFEDLALRVEDVIHQKTYRLMGSKNDVTWGGEVVNTSGGTPAPGSWVPQPVTPLGLRKGEGQWQPFLYLLDGRVVSYRSFVAPDIQQRPYAYAVIVAFEIKSTYLHFVLGTEEPKSDVKIARSGLIPAGDRKPGWLLAAFNGGFKAEHGHFGVMEAGTIIIPPRPGMGVVGLYDDGGVRIGMLGQDVVENSHLIAWRQNGPYVIQDGIINPLTSQYDPQDWGYTVGGNTATYRSALGISEDGQTLYYVAGVDLTLPALAHTLQAAGVYRAIQLDINNYWTHFDSFTSSGAGLKTVALLDFMRGVDDQRFLDAYIRDYFYITAR